MDVVRHYAHTIRPHYDKVIAVVDDHARFWRNCLKWTGLDENEIFILQWETCHFLKRPLV